MSGASGGTHPTKQSRANLFAAAGASWNLPLSIKMGGFFYPFLRRTDAEAADAGLGWGTVHFVVV